MGSSGRMRIRDSYVLIIPILDRVKTFLELIKIIAGPELCHADKIRDFRLIILASRGV